MNLESYKTEIFRRSEEKIKKRKKRRNRVLAFCIPLGLCLTALLILPNRKAEQTLSPTEALAEDEAESIFCSYVRAELTVDGKTVTVTDKLTVDKLFIIAYFEEELYGRAPTEQESDNETLADLQPTYATAEENGYAILFATAEGVTQVYTVSQKQYEEMLEVLK